MKKIMAVLLLVSFLAPASLFATTPTEEEVGKTIMYVVSVYTVAALSMDIPNVKVDFNADKKMVFTFDNLAVADVKKALGKGGTSKWDDCPFTHMSGKVIASSGNDALLDVTLKGGNVKTLYMKTSADDTVVIKANGKQYKNMEKWLDMSK